jgi:prepilin-type N-terminal cleavage/methylation domain-containing protein
MKTFKSKPVLPGANQGLTLIETLIAMAIFSIGIMAVGTLVLSTTRNNTNGNIITQATMLARAKIEEKKREVDAGTFSGDDDPTEYNIDSQGMPGGIYTRECKVDDSPSGSAWQIQVTVSWTRNGQNRSVVLNTLIKGS